MAYEPGVMNMIGRTLLQLIVQLLILSVWMIYAFAFWFLEFSGFTQDAVGQEAIRGAISYSEAQRMLAHEILTDRIWLAIALMILLGFTGLGLRFMRGLKEPAF